MRKNNRGFTLVELVVSVALLALILVPVAGFFSNSFKVQGKSSVKTSITRVGQYVMENFKNKNYLGLVVDGRSLDEYIQYKKIEGLNLENGNNKVDITGEDDWTLNYGNANYKIDIKLTYLTKMDTTDIDIPISCDDNLLIDSSGKFTPIRNAPAITTCEKGNTFTDPINGETYTADCPTIILGEAFAAIRSGDATLWLKNSYADGERFEEIRIVKEFDEELHIYVEGKNITILKGQPGDGASSKQTKITKLYVGESYDPLQANNSGEVLLDAEMRITSSIDDNISDYFEFSFPVDYNYFN